MAGRPRGAWAGKAWRNALRMAARRPADEEVKPKSNLDEMAFALIAAAKKGDVPALREIGDRLDGKVTQALEHSGPDGGAIAMQMIELVAVKPSESAD